MSTKIFKVDFRYDEYTDGKFNDNVKEFMNVTAQDASYAIRKVFEKVMKPRSFKDDELKKMVRVTKKAFDPINVNLIAEAE